MIVGYHKNFHKDLQRVSDRKIKDALKTKILEIKKEKDISTVSGIKKMKGHSTAFRIRIGNYRLGFFYVQNEVQLQRFVKRNDIYRLFP